MQAEQIQASIKGSRLAGQPPSLPATLSGQLLCFAGAPLPPGQQRHCAPLPHTRAIYELPLPRCPAGGTSSPDAPECQLLCTATSVVSSSTLGNAEVEERGRGRWHPRAHADQAAGTGEGAGTGGTRCPGQLPPTVTGPPMPTQETGDLLDTLHRGVGLVSHAARERRLLLRVLAEGRVLRQGRPRVLLRLLLPLVSPPGSIHWLPFRQIFLLQTQLRLKEKEFQQHARQCVASRGGRSGPGTVPRHVPRSARSSQATRLPQETATTACLPTCISQD